MLRSSFSASRGWMLGRLSRNYSAGGETLWKHANCSLLLQRQHEANAQNQRQRYVSSVSDFNQIPTLSFIGSRNQWDPSTISSVCFSQFGTISSRLNVPNRIASSIGQNECSDRMIQTINNSASLLNRNQLNGYAFNIENRTASILLPTPYSLNRLASLQPTRRWLSSNGNQGEGKDKVKTGKDESSENPATKDKPTDAKDANGDSKSESLDPRAFFLGTREHLRKVTEWQIGDMMATYSIVLLLGIILLSPIVGRYMRGSESTYDELDTDDQVVDMARIIRRDFLDKISEDTDLEDKGVVDSVLADVLSSKALQDQAIKFVVSIVQSKEVKEALQKLLKDLWTDLVKDPETTAQVIFLLNVAIQNEDIRLAAKKLVLEIVEDEEVLEELVRLLQKLGQDQDVLDATKTLMTESAHNALNDPEILDHSMEFATDVVGDDVVQRTAGEALRNTLSYAVQPGISIVLAATGVGLLFFAVMSLGYARSSERDAKVLDEAVSGLARSLQPNPRLDRLWGLMVLPFRAVASAANVFFTTVLLPFHVVKHGVARLEYTGSAATKAANVAACWIIGNALSSFEYIVGTCGAISSSLVFFGRATGNAFFGSLSWLCSTTTLTVSYLATTGKDLISWVTEAYVFVASLVGGVGNSTVQNVTSWLGQIEIVLRQRAYPRVWVALDSLTRLLADLKNCLASLALFVTGKSGENNASSV